MVAEVGSTFVQNRINTKHSSRADAKEEHFFNFVITLENSVITKLSIRHALVIAQGALNHRHWPHYMFNGGERNPRT